MTMHRRSTTSLPRPWLPLFMMLISASLATACSDSGFESDETSSVAQAMNREQSTAPETPATPSVAPSQEPSAGLSAAAAAPSTVHVTPSAEELAVQTRMANPVPPANDYFLGDLGMRSFFMLANHIGNTLREGTPEQVGWVATDIPAIARRLRTSTDDVANSLKALSIAQATGRQPGAIEQWVRTKSARVVIEPTEVFANSLKSAHYPETFGQSAIAKLPAKLQPRDFFFHLNELTGRIAWLDTVVSSVGVDFQIADRYEPVPVSARADLRPLTTIVNADRQVRAYREVAEPPIMAALTRLHHQFSDKFQTIPEKPSVWFKVWTDDYGTKALAVEPNASNEPTPYYQGTKGEGHAFLLVSSVMGTSARGTNMNSYVFRRVPSAPGGWLAETRSGIAVKLSVGNLVGPDMIKIALVSPMTDSARTLDRTHAWSRVSKKSDVEANSQANAWVEGLLGEGIGYGSIVGSEAGVFIPITSAAELQKFAHLFIDRTITQLTDPGYQPLLPAMLGMMAEILAEEDQNSHFESTPAPPKKKRRRAKKRKAAGETEQVAPASDTQLERKVAAAEACDDEEAQDQEAQDQEPQDQEAQDDEVQGIDDGANAWAYVPPAAADIADEAAADPNAAFLGKMAALREEVLATLPDKGVVHRRKLIVAINKILSQVDGFEARRAPRGGSHNTSHADGAGYWNLMAKNKSMPLKHAQQAVEETLDFVTKATLAASADPPNDPPAKKQAKRRKKEK